MGALSLPLSLVLFCDVPCDADDLGDFPSRNNRSKRCLQVTRPGWELYSLRIPDRLLLFDTPAIVFGDTRFLFVAKKFLWRLSA